MSSASTTTPPPATGGFTEASFETFLKGRDEPRWLIDRRREAFAQFLAIPMPTFRDEEWRRTDIRALKLDAFAPPASHDPSADAKSALAPVFEALKGHYATGIEHIDAMPTRQADPDKLGGAVFIDLGKAVKTHPELLERCLLTLAVNPGPIGSRPCTRPSGRAGSCSTCPRGSRSKGRCST
ncbi:MAG: hypothetical protein ABI353_19920 [Isosphaeraceae bacterium]